MNVKNILKKYDYKYRYIDGKNIWGYIYNYKNKQYFIDDAMSYIYEYNN